MFMTVAFIMSMVFIALVFRFPANLETYTCRCFFGYVVKDSHNAAIKRGPEQFNVVDVGLVLYIFTFFIILYDVSIAPSTLSQLCNRATREMRPLYDETHEEVQNSDTVDGDETGWFLSERYYV